MPEAEEKPEDLSFEDAMESLESIVASLEGERLPLESMVEHYERGVKLLRVCRQRMDAARQRVEIITADLEGRTATLSEFDAAGAETEARPADAPARRTPKRSKPEPQEDAPGDIRLF